LILHLLICLMDFGSMCNDMLDGFFKQFQRCKFRINMFTMRFVKTFFLSS